MTDDKIKTTAHDLALTGREVTAALREIATAIAAGAAADVLRARPSTFVPVAFPDVGAADIKRISLLVGWAMLTQHTATMIEVERKRSLAQIFAPLTTADHSVKGESP
jgi:hypothetical protein